MYKKCQSLLGSSLTSAVLHPQTIQQLNIEHNTFHNTAVDIPNGKTEIPLSVNLKCISVLSLSFFSVDKFLNSTLIYNKNIRVNMK